MAFHARPTLAKTSIFDIGSELAKLVEIGNPPLANARGDQLCQLGIAGLEPATLGDAVGFIVQPGWPELMKIAKQAAFEQCRMQFRTAFDIEHRVGVEFNPTLLFY